MNKFLDQIYVEYEKDEARSIDTAVWAALGPTIRLRQLKIVFISNPRVPAGEIWFRAGPRLENCGKIVDIDWTL